MSLTSPVLAGKFFTSEPAGKPFKMSNRASNHIIELWSLCGGVHNIRLSRSSMQSSVYNVIFRRDWKSVQKVANIHLWPVGISSIFGFLWISLCSLCFLPWSCVTLHGCMYNICVCVCICTYWGLPRWLSGLRIHLWYGRHRRCGFDPWVRKIPWRRAWQPTPVFWPGEFHGQGSLVGYRLWACKESDTTEWPLHTHTHNHGSDLPSPLLYYVP